MFYTGKRVLIMESGSEYRDMYGVILSVDDDDESCIVDVGGHHICVMMCDLS